jgi:predicted nuclease of restriction endonuclease-like (RecB) superfamily
MSKQQKTSTKNAKSKASKSKADSKKPKNPRKSKVGIKKATVLPDNPTELQRLYEKVCTILHEARANVVRRANVEMVRAYWLIGQAIVEYEQQGKERAKYGEQVIPLLSERLTTQFGQGFTSTNLKYMRQFYITFPKSHAVRDELSWTHYRLLLKLEKPGSREFYEQEAAEQNWSTRELERQITTLFYERTLLSKQKVEMLVETRSKAEKYSPEDFIKDPMVLDFLGLKESAKLRESKLESALIQYLQEFMLELGKGFSFVARQQRITIDGDHFYIDLVFYNRLLRCFVLIDLKAGKLTHQDIGQMQLYVNYYTREKREEWENPAIGILLCADKNDAMVHYTLPENQQQIFASRYRLYLPNEEELINELRREQTRLSLHAKLEQDNR